MPDKVVTQSRGILINLTPSACLIRLMAFVNR